MKRKVIQVAESTQLVSLPRKWTLKHKLKKGDEVEVVEEPDRIVIFPDKPPAEQERVTVDIRGLGRARYTLLAALYKSGYDEFKVLFSNADELRSVQQIVQENCLGFEIVEQTKDSVVARKVSEPIPDEFDPVLRRTLVFLQNVATGSFDAIVANDRDALKTVITVDSSINKFTYFCRRVLNKHGRGPYNKTSPLYYLVEVIEDIADHYKAICRLRLASNSKKLSSRSQDLYQEVNNLMIKFISLYYKFDWAKLNELHALNTKINNEMMQTLDKIPKGELPLVFRLLSIVEGLGTLDGPAVLICYDPKASIATWK